MTSLWSVCLLLLSLPAFSGDVFTSFEVQGYSQPVPLVDMAEGWENGFHSGRYAYADARYEMGVRYRNFSLGYLRRELYDLTFSRATSRYYYQLETGRETSEAYQLDLDVDAFSARGLFLAMTIDVGSWTLSPKLSRYRIDHYQFGSLRGQAQGDEATVALSYYFDQDKILDFPTDGSLGEGFSADVEPGTGYSLDLALEGEYRHHQLTVQLRDIYSYLSFPVAAETRGCVNIASDENTSCPASGGTSKETDYATRIKPSLHIEAIDGRRGWQYDIFWHDRIRKLGLGYGVETGIGRMFIAAYTTHQLGFGWRGRYGRLFLAADNKQFSDIRDMDLSLSVSVPW